MAFWYNPITQLNFVLGQITNTRCAFYKYEQLYIYKYCCHIICLKFKRKAESYDTKKEVINSSNRCWIPIMTWFDYWSVSQATIYWNNWNVWIWKTNIQINIQVVSLYYIKQTLIVWVKVLKKENTNLHNTPFTWRINYDFTRLLKGGSFVDFD